MKFKNACWKCGEFSCSPSRNSLVFSYHLLALAIANVLFQAKSYNHKGHSVAKATTKNKTFDILRLASSPRGQAPERRKQRIGGKKNNFNSEELEKKNLRKLRQNANLHKKPRNLTLAIQRNSEAYGSSPPVCL